MRPAAGLTLFRINDPDRARYARLPHDESPSLKTLHHVIYGRCRDEKVALDVRFCRRPTESVDVLGDEFEILVLTTGRPRRNRAGPIGSMNHVKVKPSADRLDLKRGAVAELNGEIRCTAHLKRGDALSGQQALDVIDVQGAPFVARSRACVRSLTILGRRTTFVETCPSCCKSRLVPVSASLSVSLRD